MTRNDRPRGSATVVFHARSTEAAALRYALERALLDAGADQRTQIQAMLERLDRGERRARRGNAERQPAVLELHGNSARVLAQSPLDPDALYLGDNGRCFCGRLEHAGASAFMRGCDISGHPVRRVTEADQREARRMGVTLSCETCRVDPRRSS